jgi:hypothetical protein
MLTLSLVVAQKLGLFTPTDDEQETERHSDACPGPHAYAAHRSVYRFPRKPPPAFRGNGPSSTAHRRS